MKKEIIPPHVVKATYFANWGDIFGFPLAAFILPFIVKIPFITPNIVTLLSFSLYVIGSVSIFLQFPSHLMVTVIALPLGFLCDDLDGQLARYRKLSSIIGDYLDKVLDVMKIFVVTASLSYGAYLDTKNPFVIYLGFIACFFFCYRYYIKLETLFSALSRDITYLDKSASTKMHLEQYIFQERKELSKSLMGRLRVLWQQNRVIFLVDEAEFAIFTALGALVNRLTLTLLILAIGQVLIALWRFIERGYQLTHNSPTLLKPLRK